MICLGYTDKEKQATIKQYNFNHIVIISADQFPLDYSHADHVTYSDSIKYVTFYRLLQEIKPNTLVVLNEVLRTQNRYDLTYNCIRHFLNQTNNVLIFQQLPQIDSKQDFMILFDFDTKSRWKRYKFDTKLILENCQLSIKPLDIRLNKTNIKTSAETKEKYQKQRQKLFDNINGRDPHIIPRRLHLLSGKDKLKILNGSTYVARNKRLKQNNVVTYSNLERPLEKQLSLFNEPDNYKLFEFPHRFIDFSDFIKETWQTTFDVLVSDLKVDRWYYQKYIQWTERINETYSDLQQ